MPRLHETWHGHYVAWMEAGRTVHALTDCAGVLQYALPPAVARRLHALCRFLEV